MSGAQVPTIGRVVIYSSKVGDGITSPAMVLRTRATTNLDVIDRWGPEPEERVSVTDDSVHLTAARPDNVVRELPDDMHVDLVVHGLGKDYREYCVPYDADGAPGTWSWPARV